MKTGFFASVLTLAAFVVVPAQAQAQRIGKGRPTVRGYRRPVTSPYLNLLNSQLQQSGNSFAFEYFRRVRPELELRQANEALSRSIQNLDRRVNEQQQQLQGAGLGPTGHQTYFFNYSGYYNFGATRSPGRR